MNKCSFCFRAGTGTDGTCPHCGTAHAPDWHGSRVTCIALAGAVNTGKSIYIGVLVPQLQQLVRLQKGVLRFADAGSEQRYREHYRKPLFQERAMIPPTTSMKAAGHQRDPLVLRIDAATGPRHYLVIRDVAGEDLERVSPEVDLTFFAHADAVLFLFDPYHVREVREKLQMPPPPSMRQPQDVLDTVLDLMRPGASRIGVALSKFDALQELGEAEGAGWEEIMSNPGAAFLRESSFTPTYDEDDGALLHEEVRSLLLRLDAHEILNRVAPLEAEHPGRMRYFAVSALGARARGTHVDARGIAPFRCTDPVRWVCTGSEVL